MADNVLPEASTVFHAGELAVQARVGVTDEAARMRARAIRSYMPDQHRAFYNQLPFMVTGATDASGQPWASAAFGPPGFVSSPDPETLILKTVPVLADQLGMQLGAGNKLGLLGIELQTRRRNRVNVTVSGEREQGLTLTVDQSYGNCPQYIQVRELSWRANAADSSGIVPAVETTVTNKAPRALINRSDMFFIASRSVDMSDDKRSGLDASHRGGKPGFVRVAKDGRISFPDFSGNLFFNTIGNIQSDPRVGLFFPDFESGDAVFVAGKAHAEWDGPNVDAFEGAERLIHVIPDRVIHAKTALPIAGKLVEIWPRLAETGDWA